MPSNVKPLHEFTRPGLWIGNVWYPKARARREIARMEGQPQPGDDTVSVAPTVCFYPGIEGDYDPA